MTRSAGLQNALRRFVTFNGAQCGVVSMNHTSVQNTLRQLPAVVRAFMRATRSVPRFSVAECLHVSYNRAAIGANEYHKGMWVWYPRRPGQRRYQYVAYLSMHDTRADEYAFAQFHVIPSNVYGAAEAAASRPANGAMQHGTPRAIATPVGSIASRSMAVPVRAGSMIIVRTDTIHALSNPYDQFDTDQAPRCALTIPIGMLPMCAENGAFIATRQYPSIIGGTILDENGLCTRAPKRNPKEPLFDFSPVGAWLAGFDQSPDSSDSLLSKLMDEFDTLPDDNNTNNTNNTQSPTAAAANATATATAAGSRPKTLFDLL
jgi:hypothetical protein